MKKDYLAPELDIDLFQNEEVIGTSQINPDTNPDRGDIELPIIPIG